MRISHLVLLAVVAACLVAPTALADKPVREFLPADDFTITEDICGFAVDVEFLTNKGHGLFFSDGRLTTTGALKVRVTNVDDTTRSLVLNIPGPGFFDETSLTGTGPWLLFFEEDELGEGTPALMLFVTGRFRIDEDGYTCSAGGRSTSARCSARDALGIRVAAVAALRAHEHCQAWEP